MNSLRDSSENNFLAYFGGDKFCMPVIFIQIPPSFFTYLKERKKNVTIIATLIFYNIYTRSRQNS
jgi:hypothetical protein